MRELKGWSEKDAWRHVKQSIERGSLVPGQKRFDLTQTQRRFAPSYQRGMVIQPERDYAKAA